MVFAAAFLVAVATITLEPREYSTDELKRLIGDGHDVVVRSADANHPAVVTGGRRIVGWRVGADGAWRVTLDEVKAGKWNFSQLFVNGSRRFRTRVPESGWFEAVAPARVEKDRKSPAFGYGAFRYAGDMLNPNWSNRDDLEIQMLFNWNGARMRVKSIDAAAHEVNLTAPIPSVASQHDPAGRRFAVENVKEAFGACGRWYLDRPTGVLAYQPFPGESVEDCTVEAPCDEMLLELADASDVRFERIVFRLNNPVTPWKGTEFSAQGEVRSGAAIAVRGSREVTFEGCWFVNLGNWAVSFDDACEDCRVSECVIADVGSGGVLIGSTDKAAKRITVADTEIRSYGRRNPGSPAIMATQGEGCRFAHNHIHDGFYTGISIGWGWRVEEHPISHHNEIGFNHIHDIGQRQMSDLGFIYLLCRQPGTRVHHNYLHDAAHWQYGSYGIYPDECSGFEEIDHNFVRNASCLLHCNMVHGLDVHDNVFADGFEMQWNFSSDIGDDGTLLKLHHNTFVWNGAPLSCRNISLKATPEERRTFSAPFWQGIELHDNVYFNRAGDSRVFPSADIRAENPPRLMLAEFQKASGQEGGSQFRDPGLLDPLAVCGETGVRASARTAKWKMPDPVTPFGDDERMVQLRANRKFTMNDGLATSLAKLRGGGRFTVAYFGGSITEGTSYRPPFTEWLRAKYPKAQIGEVNAGIGGTGSNLGVYRLERDVLRFNPDLVFVEFALNDSDRSSCEWNRVAASAESIVRQIWRHDAKTDIVFLYTVSRKLYEQSFSHGVLTPEASAYELIAERYRIPTVNFAVPVDEMVRSGKLVWTLGLAPTAVPKEDPDYNAKVAAEMKAAGKLVFSNDGVHPRAEGGMLYVAALTNLFSQTMPNPYAWNRPNIIARTPFAPNPYQNPASVELKKEWLKGSWRRVAKGDALARFLARTDSMWVSDTPGDRMEFSFEGSEVSLYALYGPSGARLKVWVDGVPQPSRDLCDRYCTYWRLMRLPLFRGACARHRVEIEIDAAQPDRESVRAFRKLTAEQAAKIGFDGHRAAVGLVLLDGKPQ